VNFFSHLAQSAKLPTAGLGPKVDFDSAVYASSSSSDSSSSFFFLAAALSFASAAFVSFFFLGGDSGSSRLSDAYPSCEEL
jgi:hypothetical protein